jgi:hypothetical protein
MPYHKCRANRILRAILDADCALLVCEPSRHPPFSDMALARAPSASAIRLSMINGPGGFARAPSTAPSVDLDHQFAGDFQVNVTPPCT